MIPALKVPRTMRLKPKYDELLPNVTSTFNLRRYMKGGGTTKRVRPMSAGAKALAASAVAEMPPPMSLPGCGGGHARRARAIYFHGRRAHYSTFRLDVSITYGMHGVVAVKTGSG